MKNSSREHYKIDEHHTWMIAKYGAVIKCQIGENVTWKKAKKDIDFDKLKTGKLKLSDILDTSSSSGRLLGEYKKQKMYLKKGQYGLYVEWGDNKKSLSYLQKEECEITLEDVITYITNPSSILREISGDMSIRNGKYGPYIFYKSKQMKRPQFLKLRGFKLEDGEDYETCDIERLTTWIEETYSV